MSAQWLDIPGLATRLNVPEGWVKKAVTARSIPITWVGKHARFTEADVAAIEAAGKELPGGVGDQAEAWLARLATGPRPPAGPPVPRPPAGPPTPSKARIRRRSA